jgi:hypothetical protein
LVASRPGASHSNRISLGSKKVIGNSIREIRNCTGINLQLDEAISDLRKISDLALRSRREGLAKLLRRTLCHFRQSQLQVRPRRTARTHLYLTVTLGPGRTTGGIVPLEKVQQVRHWIENYQTFKEKLEKISEINRELLRRERARRRGQ